MKHFHLIICLFLFSYGATAQNKSIDSLKNALKTVSQDTNRVNVLNAIALDFIRNDQFDSAFRYAKPAVDLAEKLQYQHGLVSAYHSLAAFNFHIKEYKPGKFFLLKSLNAALTTHDKKNTANDYKELADLYQLQGNFKLEKQSKEKFILYNDSSTKEDNDRHAAELKALTEKREKEKNNLATKESKTTLLNDAKRQQILYISLAVLLVLSILLVWLLVSRSKSKAKKSAVPADESIDNKTNAFNESIVQPQKAAAEKLSFLQKIAEKEALATKPNSEEKPQIIENQLFAIQTLETENQAEKVPAIENKPIAIEEKLEPEPNQKSIEPDLQVTENTNGDVIGQDEEHIAAPVIINQFSNKISQNNLLHFAAKLINEKVKLVWKTSDEKNIVGFGIEKSVDNIQFINIENRVAQGFDGNEYETFDLQPLPGITYYRIEIIDTDRNFIFSPVIQIEILPATTLELICYPTRVKNIVMVTATGGKLPVAVNIYDSIGRKKITVEVPPVTTPIFLNDLAIGTYTLQMKCQGKTVLQQLVKIA